MIATYVSSQNDCYFCQHADGAVVAYRLDGREKLVNDVRLNVESTAISDKMKAPLAIAGRVQKGGKQARPTSTEIEGGGAVFESSGRTFVGDHVGLSISVALCVLQSGNDLHR
jgi:hypothetical protein